MATIELITLIAAPIERVFDLSRDIGLHMQSTAHTQERAIAGVTSGLIDLHQEVTWRARHLGIWQTLTVRITEFNRPVHFRDTMLRGAFRSMHHDHYFEVQGEGTVMRDVIVFAAPFGIFGRLAEGLFLNSYMRDFLARRNAVIKEVAESGTRDDPV